MSEQLTQEDLVTELVVADYRRARDENDYPAQAGILVALLRRLATGDDPLGIVQATSVAVIQEHDAR